MSRPIQALIDLNALKSNLQVVRRHAPGSSVYAIIKANAYGHGMLRAAQALNDADGFALLELDDAVRLREAGFRQRILLLEGFFDPLELPTIAESGLALVIHAIEQVEMLEATWLPVRLDVSVKINTGMNRLGFAPEMVAQVITRLKACPIVGNIMLMTHFATADESAGIARQLAQFDALSKDLNLPVSLANSAAILRFPESHRDWVRPGIMLYGSSPFPGISAEELTLQPAMTLSTEIIGIQHLKAGDEVGYGAAYRADRETRIAVVACGYADGYPRHAPSGTPILVCGKLTKTVGRVSMDMLCADVTTIPEALVGSPVTLWGRGLPADEIAKAAETVSYELFCAVTSRVPMVEES